MWVELKYLDGHGVMILLYILSVNQCTHNTCCKDSFSLLESVPSLSLELKWHRRLAMEGKGKSCAHHDVQVMTCRTKRGLATSSSTPAPAPSRPQGPPQHLPTSSLLTATPPAPHRVSGSPEHVVKSFNIKNGTKSLLPRGVR